MFDTLIVFLKEFFKKVDFEINQQTTKTLEKFPRGQRVNMHVQLCSGARFLIFGL